MYFCSGSFYSRESVIKADKNLTLRATSAILGNLVPRILSPACLDSPKSNPSQVYLTWIHPNLKQYLGLRTETSPLAPSIEVQQAEARGPPAAIQIR